MTRVLLQMQCACMVLVMSCAKSESGGTKNEGEGQGDTPAATYVPVEGEEATQHLRHSSQSLPDDDTGLDQLLDIAVNEYAEQSAGTDPAAVIRLDDAALRLARAASSYVETFDPGSFVLPDDSSFSIEPRTNGSGLMPPEVPSTFNAATDKVKLDAASWKNKTKFNISRMGKVSVKHQGNRGTCAAHTGISYLEYKALAKYPKKLKSIDLSEQRFYMMSKKDLWSTGGVTGQQAGSAWGHGFELSNGFWGETVPSEKLTVNIPVEADCPYNPAAGANEIQVPQKKTCQRGAVKVTKTSTVWYWSFAGETPKWYSDAVRSAQQIFDYMLTYDLPVPVSANITDGWATNNGMITLAGSKGQTPIGGHAFLIVGARKLDEKQYPKEGGMCFVVKNSWGTGWGSKGYSCMTLAWWNKYRHTDFFPIAHEIEVDVRYIINRATSKALPAAAPTVNEPHPLQTVKVDAPEDNLLALTAGEEETTGEDLPDYDQVAPEVNAEGYTLGFLSAPDGHLVNAAFKAEGQSVRIRGIMASDGSETADLVLGWDGSSRILLDAAARGTVVVGELKGDTLVLCTQEYQGVCHLNIVPAEKRLVLGLTEKEFNRGAADPTATYVPLATFGSDSIEYALAGTAAVDIRLVRDGAPAGAVRLGIRVADGVITYNDRDIGSIKDLSLCSGAYRGACRLVAGTADQSLHVFLRPK